MTQEQSERIKEEARLANERKMQGICKSCEGYFQTERRCRCGKYPSPGSSRGHAEDEANHANADSCEDRGVMPVEENGISVERITEVIRGLNRLPIDTTRRYWKHHASRIAEAIDLLEAVAAFQQSRESRAALRRALDFPS